MRVLYSLNDDCLSALLKESSRDAFDEIYHRYHAAIYQNVHKLTKDAEAAEDLVQETFITLWQKRNSIRSDKSLAGWVFVISYHQSVNWLKRKWVETKAKQLLGVSLIQTDNISDYEQQMEVLEKAILLLPPQKRRVLTLCKLQGKSYKEAAKELNISTHTVKEYLSGAMKVVREYAIAHPEYKVTVPILMVSGFFF